jgi:hypothetical protein
MALNLALDTPTNEVDLFLSSPNIDTTADHLAVRLPPKSETYYWSFDPEGLDRLSPDALDKLALPRATFQAQVSGAQWRQEEYDSIGKFHLAKGFDPTGPDVAIKLGYPLVDIEQLNNIITSQKAIILGMEGGGTVSN